MASEAKKRVPVREGLYRVPTDGEKGYLIGSRCKRCGDYFHPRKVVCANCYSQEMEEVALSSRGTIHTYTIARTSYPMTPLVAPFIVGEVKLTEEVQVLTLVTDIEFDAVKIGMDVELHFWKVREDEEGNEVMAYAFRPVST